MHASLAFVAHKFFWVFFDHIYKLTKSYVDSKIFQYNNELSKG